jgi:hypothetical protein
MAGSEKPGEGKQEAKATDTSVARPATPPQEPPALDGPPSQPLLVRLVRGDDLKPFEVQTLAIAKETLTISRRTYWISIFGFLAALAAACFVGVQVAEMSDQTQILASQSEGASAGALMDEMNTRKQLDIVQKQAKAAEESADAAKSQLIQTEKAFMLDQWPYMSESKTELAEPIAADHEIHVNITFKNIGKSPAQDIRIYRDSELIQITGQEGDVRIQVEKLFSDARKTIEPHHYQTIPPTRDIFTTTQRRLRPTKEQVDAIVSQQLELVVIAGVAYRDIFGGQHETETCQVIVGPELRVWHYCKIHNVMR